MKKMKKRLEKIKPLIYITIIYILVQGIGIYISYTGPAEIFEKPTTPDGNPGIIQSIKQNQTTAAVQNGQEITSVIPIFAYIIVVTALLLVLIKYRLGKIIPLIVYLGLFGGLLFTLSGLFGQTLGAIATIIFFAYAIWKRNNMQVTNIMLIFAIPWIGSWLGASLSFWPALILLVGLAIYDLIAVFGTKHMVTLAEEAKGKIPLMVGVPAGERMMGLGTGDLAIPLMFTISVLADTNLTTAITTSLGGLLGLTLLFAYILNKKDVVLPALPPLAAGLILGYLVGIII